MLMNDSILPNYQNLDDFWKSLLNMPRMLTGFTDPMLFYKIVRRIRADFNHK